MKNIYLVLIALLICVCAEAQSIKLIKDINSGSDKSAPKVLATMANGEILFKATTKAQGEELWKSDGTANGTVLVKDILPGSQSGMKRNPTLFINNKLYFIGNDGVHGEELWVTDGTTAGTKMIKDVNPGIGDGIFNATTLVYLNGDIYYAGETDNEGVELWKTDGSELGTTMIKDINSGASGSFSKYFIIAFGKIYFSANDGVHGVELWSTDGTEKGTTMVDDFNPKNGSNISDRLVFYNNKIYFSAKASDAIGSELCSSDGNTVSLVKNINTLNAASSGPNRLTVVGNTLYFTAEENTTGRELWSTDGTENGTKLVKNISPGIFNSDPYRLTDFNGQLLFSADNGTNGRELWITDGTENGTNILKDINTGNADGYSNVLSSTFDYLNYISATQIHNGLYYFCGDDGSSGWELWQTDGTENGTKIVEHIGNNPDKSVSSELSWIYIEQSNIWLSMTDGLTGTELYKYEIPTQPNSVKNINSIQNHATIYPNPSNGNFTLKLNNTSFKNGFVQIRNITGQIIHSQTIQSSVSQHSIAIPNVIAGIYTITIQLDNEMVMKKVMVK